MLQRLSITRRFFAAGALALACATHGATPAADGVPGPSPLASALGFRPAPEFLTVFAPRLHRDAYAAWISSLPLERVLQRLESAPELLHPPGSWQAMPSLPADAFGNTGTYDKSRLARLYGSMRVTVARGPVAPTGSPAQMWSLFSPYPNPRLDRLETGTLLIVVTLPGR